MPEKTEPRAHTTRSGRGGSGVYKLNMAERHDRVKRCFYSREVLAELESTLSPDQLSMYLRSVPDRGKDQAVRLYIWNVAMSSVDSD